MSMKVLRSMIFILNQNSIIKKHDIHIKLISYKFELLGELIVEHYIRPWFDKKF